VSGSLYGMEALRRFREQHGHVAEPAQPVQADDDDQVIVSDDDDGDDFDDLFDAWVDHKMEVSG
jgi:hypothetical protein